MDPRQIGPKRGAGQGQEDARTDEQKPKDLDYLETKVEILQEQFLSAAQQLTRSQQQSDSRITELEKRCFALEGKVSDQGFRIADHDHQLNHSGVTGTAKRWPVVTSQILAAVFNVLVVLPAAAWDVLPAPWPLVVASVLQAVAAVIGGQFTESKADLARLQDGQRVAPLVKVADSSGFYPGQTVRIEGPSAEGEGVRRVEPLTYSKGPRGPGQ